MTGIVRSSTTGALTTDVSCPFCDGAVEVRNVTEQVPFATPNGEVTLTVNVPYEQCTSCGYEGFGEAGERARTEAAYRHLGRLTPWEIVAIREGLGLSQAEFAEWLGVGRASLERWERGATMHNQSMDNLILLLSQPSRKAVLDAERSGRLRASIPTQDIVDLSRFRALRQKDGADLATRQARFRLRRQA